MINVKNVKIIFVEVKKILGECKVKEIHLKNMEEMYEHMGTLKRNDEVIYVIGNKKRIYRSGKGIEFEVNHNPDNGLGSYDDILSP